MTPPELGNCDSVAAKETRWAQGAEVWIGLVNGRAPRQAQCPRERSRVGSGCRTVRASSSGETTGRSRGRVYEASAIYNAVYGPVSLEASTVHPELP